MFSSDILSEIDKTVDRKKEVPALMTWTVKRNRKGIEKPVLVVITPYSFYLFRKIGESIKYQSVCYFYNVKEMKKNSKGFRIKFSDNVYTVLGPEAQMIAEICAFQVFSIFYHEEVPFISRASFPSNSVPTPLNRFLAKEVSKGNFPRQAIIDQLIEYLAEGRQEFDVGHIIGLWNYLGGVLFAIKTLPYITHLIIPRIDVQSAWESLVKFWDDNKYCRWITISLPVFPEEGFRRWALKISEKPNDTVEVIEFKDISFFYSTVSILYSTFSQNKLQKLIFNHCSLGLEEEKFLDLMSSIRSRSKIEGIGFVKMNFEQPLELISKIERLKYITLAGLGLQIAPLIKRLLRLGLYSLDLSGNKTDEELDDKFTISSEPFKLSINDMNWTASNLFKLISKVKTAPGWCTLEMANTKMEESEWHQFDQLIKKADPEHIDSINWSQNYISNKIMEFMTKGELNFISLAGIDLSSCAAYLSKFHCKYFDLHGTDKYQMKDHALEIMTILTTSKIDFVNIAHNNIGSKNLESLGNIISKFEYLRCISLDDNNFTDIAELRKFGDFFSDDKHFYIWFPERDVSKLTLKTHPSVAAKLKEHFHLPKHSRRGTLAGDEWMNVIYGYFAEQEVFPKDHDYSDDYEEDGEESTESIDDGRDNLTSSSDEAYLDLT
ncbi:hypothetical protein TVAG_199060 [Trichomonas vaginalis G3]|uniref:Leucine Rich Repeat family protein n=1 Tax=Trichomonas vaginalis (strain ATCC PRA-98 / G3) TaxID=412133 RepID=A2DDU1_TRIV3|nr:ribonuclease inhibitor domain-containing protein [Trichomonas vaginalis G3]EAY21467.1 hypothetical protein TVAG_199060 [Trichomonas vaginalis G3]KAI5490680.1 ribonuclease inhibitor domain-containing protein [Trichomonas vaginalis G3]|eukprot:XP_001582453.1 hypothetical protein [Trichomonas vaginalis G3]